MFTRKGLATFAVAALISTFLATQATAATVKVGASCSKRGLITQVSGKWYICGLTTGRLVWSLGTLVPTPKKTSTPKPTPTPTPTPVKVNPASAITHPPSSLVGINTESNWVEGGLDPAIVTLGPTKSTDGSTTVNWYTDKVGMNFYIGYGQPVLAPIDGKFVGFNNRNANYRAADALGPLRQPFDDLEVCFESTSSDWPKLVYCFYHLQNSPLLRGLNIDPLCGRSDSWPGPMRAAGRQIFSTNEEIAPASTAGTACAGLIGKTVKRGSVVGYAGTVATHSQAPMKVKVWNSKRNTLEKNGDLNLHWVQPDAFFFWKCYSPTANYESGIMAYPFECGGYQVPSEQKSTTFKY